MDQSQKIFKVLNFISEPKLRKEILEKSQLIQSNIGDFVVREGEYVKVLPIVIEGAIRVFQTRDNREILLYYVELGETCMMSLSACFFNQSSSIQAICDKPTTILTIPVEHITKWQSEFKSWNNFVLKTFRKRYDELLDAYESVAFDHIDKRVMEYLVSRKSKETNNKISISHLNLANELGTTRVVVSRILKQFELEQKLKLHRGIIEVL